MQQNQQVAQQQPKIGIAALKSVLNNDAIKQKFADMLGKKAQGFITSVINVCSNNNLLANAEANSIVLSAANAAALDLPIDPNLGFAALIPFNDRKKGLTICTFQIQRNGWVELAQRTGQVARLVCEPVFEGELVKKNRFTEEYVFDEDQRKSENVIGYMAYLELTTGFKKTIYWTVDEIKRHALRYSQTYKKGYGLWVDNFDAMARKTLIKHIIVKYAPKSIELQNAIKNDDASFVGEIGNSRPVYLDSPQTEVGEPVDFEEVDTDSGEVQQEEEPKTVIVVEEDNGAHERQEPSNGELFNEPRQREE